MARYTKLHFEAVARILKTSKTKKEMTNKFANLFARENPLFDEPRFRKAAGNPGPKKKKRKKKAGFHTFVR